MVFAHGPTLAPRRLKQVLIGTIGLLMLSACAPTQPFRTVDSAVISDRAVEPDQIERRSARTGAQRADPAILVLRRALAQERLTPTFLLDTLERYSLNEIRWQWQQCAATDELKPWLELGWLVLDHRLDATSLSNSLDQWRARHGSELASESMMSESLNWVSRWQSQYHGPQTLGVILPGQSTFAAAGQALREGLMDAWLLLEPGIRPKLLFYYLDDANPSDLWNIPARAKADGVDWLIGPLPRQQVELITQAPSRRWPVPTLLLNLPSGPDRESLDANRQLAFALNPEQDARQAAELAKALELNRALVLAQNTAWGQRMAEAFSRSYEGGDQRVIEQAFYDPNQVDHTQLLEAVLGLDQSAERIRALERLLNQPVISEPERRNDIDMIFLAARADDARQIRPQLRFFRAEDLPVITTTHAIDGAVDSRRDVDLEGVFLPIPPWFMSVPEWALDRTEAQSRHPNMEGAALLGLYAMGRDLSAITRWLYALQQDQDLALSGMTGQLSISPSGTVDRALTFVTIEQGQTKLLDWP